MWLLIKGEKTVYGADFFQLLSKMQRTSGARSKLLRQLRANNVSRSPDN